MKQFLYVLLSLISFQVIGQLSPKQEQTIDSLKRCINTAAHDTIKISAYYAWDNIIYLSDPKLDLELNQKIVDLANQNLEKESLTNSKKKAFKKELSRGLNSIGIIFYDKGDYDKALNYYTRSLKIREEIGDKKGIAATLNNFGIVFQDLGDNAKAIDYYTRSLNTNEEIGDKNGEANNLSNIGRIYREQQELAKAINYLTRSLKIKEEIGEKRGMAIAYNNLGTIYSDQGNEAKAMEYFTRDLKLSEEIGDKNRIALALGNLGFAYELQEDNSKAMDYFNHSLKMFEEIGNKKWTAELLNKIGVLYKKKGETERAIEYYKKALAIAQGAGLVSTTKDASLNLSLSYKFTGNYKEALNMHELYIKMRDSILSEKSQKEIMKQEIKYTYDKQKALDAKEHEKQIAISSEREQKQRVITYAISGSLILVLVFTFFVFNRLRITRKQKNIIELQKNEVLQQKEIVEKQKEKIIDSITYAKRIQQSILMEESEIQNYLSNNFIYFQPKDIVSGDFYWCSKIDDKIIFAAVDCTGHGVPGAFMSMIGNTLLNQIVNEKHITTPSEILRLLNLGVYEALHQEKDGALSPDGMDIALCTIDYKNNEIQYAGAQNPLYVVLGNQIEVVKADIHGIGGGGLIAKIIDPLKVEYSNHVIPIKKNMSLYLFSDGYSDQFGGPLEKKFGTQKFKELLLSKQNLSMQKQKEHIASTHEEWKGNGAQIDDILVVGIKL